MKELSIIESSVLNLIPRGDVIKITASEIAESIGLDRREVFSVIVSLIYKGVPIVAQRGVHKGYYIATTEQERLNGLIPLKNQLANTQSHIEHVEKADLKNWHKTIKVS